MNGKMQSKGEISLFGLELEMKLSAMSRNQ